MAHIPFQNNVIDLNQLFYNSHKNLIKRVAGELGAKDRQDELIKKLLGDPLKIKRQRDPLMPKKPNTSYLYFCADHREKVKNENKNISIGDTMKILGKMWREYPDKEKYVKMATEAKESYEEDMEEYRLNNFYE